MLARLSPLPGGAAPLAWEKKSICTSSRPRIRRQSLLVAKLLLQSHSTRSFDNREPITLAELSQFLGGAARVVSISNAEFDLDDGGHAVRPYPRRRAPATSSVLIWRSTHARDLREASVITTRALAVLLALIRVPMQKTRSANDVEPGIQSGPDRCASNLDHDRMRALAGFHGSTVRSRIRSS